MGNFLPQWQAMQPSLFVLSAVKTEYGLELVSLPAGSWSQICQGTRQRPRSWLCSWGSKGPKGFNSGSCSGTEQRLLFPYVCGRQAEIAPDIESAGLEPFRPSQEIQDVLNLFGKVSALSGLLSASLDLGCICAHPDSSLLAKVSNVSGSSGWRNLSSAGLQLCHSAFPLRPESLPKG